MKTVMCQVPNCQNKAKSGYAMCSGHRERKRLKGDVMAHIPLKKLENHGMSNSPEYRSWHHALQRVTNANVNHYDRYGGRGITMCDEWLNSFEQFYKDMGPRPKGTTLDRKDPNGNYEPSNCQWANRLQQAINTNIRSNNTSGHKGIVALKNDTWTAQIGFQRKVYNLGTFKTMEAAIEARKQAEVKYWGITV